MTAPSPVLVGRRRVALLVVVAVDRVPGEQGLDWMHLLLVPIVLGAQPL